MAETVLVTGGTGYVGGWAIVALLKAGYDVRTTVRSASKEGTVRDAVGERVGFAIADLTDDGGWDAAMEGVDYVLHVASPLADESSKDPDAQIVPARDGAVRVLRAATRAGVKRMVMTSAANAASPASYTSAGVTDETLWTVDSPSLPAYRRSKTLAEKAVWDFMEGYDGPTELTTVLPGAVFGPILAADNVGTTQIIQRMLTGKMPGTPKIGLEVVDVRDLVDLHIRAMVVPEAAGSGSSAPVSSSGCARSRRRSRMGSARRQRECRPANFRTSWCGSPRSPIHHCGRSRSRSGVATGTPRRRPSVSWAGRPAPQPRRSSNAPRV